MSSSFFWKGVKFFIFESSAFGVISLFRKWGPRKDIFNLLNFLWQSDSNNIFVAVIAYLSHGLIVNRFWSIRDTVWFLQLNVKMNVWKMLIS